MRIFNDVAFKSLYGALDGLMTRQRVTTNNIANVDTPGFKAQYVNFEDQLQLALRTDDAVSGLPLSATHSGHLQFSLNSGSPLIEIGHNQNDLRNDTNNVDIDLEMTSLAETNLRYQALTQLTSNKLGLLKRIVRGGR